MPFDLSLQDIALYKFHLLLLLLRRRIKKDCIQQSGLPVAVCWPGSLYCLPADVYWSSGRSCGRQDAAVRCVCPWLGPQSI